MSEIEIELLEKWLDDTSFQNWATAKNSSDIIKWDTYLVENDHHHELAKLGRTAILNLQTQPVEKNQGAAQAALERLKETIATNDKIRQPKVRTLWRPWMAAASVALLLVFGFWGYSSLIEDGSTIVYSTEDSKGEFVLSDGSKVILNKHSAITFNENQPRQINLDGEGYFKVKGEYETGKTFQVNTKDLLVTVLGTEFNVNSRYERTSVFLDKGKVSLSMNDKDIRVIEMEPGELVSYSKKQNKILVNQKSKTLENTAWKEDVILFDETPLLEVFQVISNVYEIKFEREDSFPETKVFSGGLPSDRIDITLKTLTELYNLDIKPISEHVYQIKQKK